MSSGMSDSQKRPRRLEARGPGGRSSQAAPAGDRSPSTRLARRAARGRKCVWVLAGVWLLAALGCASSRVKDLDAYDEVPMNRVVPFPSRDELRKRAFEVVVVDRPAVGIDEELLAKPRAQVRRALEAISAEAGAALIDRSLQTVSAIRTEGVLSELEGEEAEDVTGADFALATRFSTYRYTATWKKPFKFLWQSAEDIAAKPGTCRHRTEVEFDIQVIEIGSNDRVSQTFSLDHAVEQTNKDLDAACTIAPVTLSVMFENTIDDALGCLEIPLGSLLAPRGHVTGHRKAPGAERHVYRISLGRGQGIEPGDAIEIRREQRSMNPMGEETAVERVIATGVVSDQVAAQQSWVALDPADAVTEILKGDVARPVLREGLLSSLSGPKCSEILQAR